MKVLLHSNVDENKPALIDSNPEMGTRAKTMEQTEYAWAAGFIEADGCIHASIDLAGSAKVEVIIVQKDIRPLLRFQRIYQDHSTIGVVTRRQGTAKYYRLVFHAQRAQRLLESVLPYLEFKHAQATAALTLLAYLQQTYQKGRTKLPSAIRQRRAELVQFTRQAERLSEPAPVRHAG